MSPKKGSEPLSGRKEERITPPPSSSRFSSIKCFKCLGKGQITFQCPNKRTMVLRENEESTSSSDIESSSDHSYYEGDFLMVKRLMSNMIGEEDESQFFHSRCLVLEKLCSIIIDGRRSVNVASSRLVGKLGIPNLTSYNSLYVDDVMCDVVSMEATHILLGKSWQFDRKVIYDSVILKLLSPREFCENQINMRIKRKEEIKEKEKVKKAREKTKKSKSDREKKEEK
ncbi:hypothetical protein CR513_55874, partial [Mucuna pruriens]